MARLKQPRPSFGSQVPTHMNSKSMINPYANYGSSNLNIGESPKGCMDATVDLQTRMRGK